MKCLQAVATTRGTPKSDSMKGSPREGAWRGRRYSQNKRYKADEVKKDNDYYKHRCLPEQRFAYWDAAQGLMRAA